ncbi:MAG: site-specific integrase [Parvibaculaceae bacterium]
MSKTYRLIKVKGTYYYRRRVPKLYVELFGKGIIKDCLKTNSAKEAASRRAQKDVEYDTLFASFDEKIDSKLNPPAMTQADAMNLVRAFVEKKDTEAEKSFAEDPPESEIQRREMLAESTQDWASLADPRFLKEHGIDSRVLEEVIANIPFKFDQSIFSYAQFYSLVIRGLRELHRRDMARLKAEHEQNAFDQLFAEGVVNAALVHAPMSNPKSLMTFGDLADRFVEDYCDEAVVKGTSQKTIDSTKAETSFVKEAIGEATIVSNIDYEVCKEFRKLLARTPSNRKKIYGDLSVEEAAQQAAKDGKPTLSHITQNTYLRTLTAVLKHGVRIGCISQVPSEGLQPLSEKTKASEKRRPFSSSELITIFNAPLYRGCVDDGRNYAKPGPDVIRRARFWFPLIGLFTGMRANEIAQLKVADLKEMKGGHFYFDVNDADGKKLKTKTSTRAFPVHPELVKFGLLQYADQIRKLGKKNLFPELKPGSYGYASDRIADWFSDGFLPRVVKKDGRVSFHSFRHNFRDALREAEAPDFVLRELGGWSVSKGVSDNYGSGHKPEQLMEHVAKIAYPDLDLSHLYVK